VPQAARARAGKCRGPISENGRSTDFVLSASGADLARVNGYYWIIGACGAHNRVEVNRITIYNLLPYFLDASMAETDVAELYGLSVEQVAAARAYILNHADAVLARHREIESRLGRGNPPELVEQLKETHARLLQFREWRARHADAARARGCQVSQSPTFEQWLAEHGDRDRIFVPR
jgi:uncharacterized protein (DUF433 family)